MGNELCVPSSRAEFSALTMYMRAGFTGDQGISPHQLVLGSSPSRRDGSTLS
jgi:hypothetical protein